MQQASRGGGARAGSYRTHNLTLLRVRPAPKCVPDSSGTTKPRSRRGFVVPRFPLPIGCPESCRAAFVASRPVIGESRQRPCFIDWPILSLAEPANTFRFESLSLRQEEGVSKKCLPYETLATFRGSKRSGRSYPRAVLCLSLP